MVTSLLSSEVYVYDDTRFFKYMEGKLIEGFELNYYPIKLLYSYIYDSTNHAQSAKPGFFKTYAESLFQRFI